MSIRSLPPEALEALNYVKSPPRLIRHHEVVHEVACRLIDRFEKAWPRPFFNPTIVKMGAAIHDIGKARYPQEMDGPGEKHEQFGVVIATEAGLEPPVSYFAKLHSAHANGDAIMEIWMVALADVIWKGARSDDIETAICKMIARDHKLNRWEVWGELDLIISDVAEDYLQYLEYCR